MGLGNPELGVSAARPSRNGTVKRPAGKVALPDILKSADEFKTTMGMSS